MRFTWDSKKASENVRKHGVAFEEAETIFYDEHALQVDDPDSLVEQRFLMLGLRER